MAVQFQVDFQTIQNGINSFNNSIQRQQQILQQLTTLFRTIAAVAWLSPAAAAFAKKVLLMLENVNRMIRALIATREKLEFTLQSFTNAENQVESNVNSLPTNAFQN